MRGVLMGLLGLLCCSAWAATTGGIQEAQGNFSCELEIGYFDLAAGPLAISDDPVTALRDGCAICIFEDSDQDRAVSTSDRMLIPQNVADQAEVAFSLNGEALLGLPGYFCQTAHFNLVCSPRVYLRIYSSTTPESSDQYWESPMYTLLPGRQQLSFRKSELQFHQGKTLPSVGAHDRDAPEFATPKLTTPNQITSYPNPFNSTSSIAFELTEAASIRMSIFDLQGRIVRTLAEGNLSAGSHTYEFEARDLPSGTYLVSLEKNGRLFTTRRVMLIK